MNVIRWLFPILRKRKRAVSPVVAVILLIGLAVAAGAMVFFIVLPMFEANPELSVVPDSTYVKYSSYETQRNESVGWAEAGIMVVNSGTGAAEIKSKPTVSYQIGTGSFSTISSANTLSYEIDSNNSLEVPAASEQLIKIFFALPPENNNNSVSYKFEIKYQEGTITATEGGQGALTLSKDRPDITLTLDSEIRRTVDLAPSASDNSQIKNVTYYVNGSIANYTDTNAPWGWSWNTRNTSANGLDNGNINITVVVWDYAGLSNTNTVNTTIDNDYTPPTIIDYSTHQPYDNDTVELGESATIWANVTDSGCGDSKVSSVILWYKISELDDTFYINHSVSMSPFGVSNTYQGNIGSAYTSMTAFEKNLTYWIEAIDLDGNTIDTAENVVTVIVVDKKSPDISHTPITSTYYRDAIEINATITDPGGSTATLWYRISNDTDFTHAPYSWTDNSMTNTSNLFTYTIPMSTVLLDGLDYFINATDLTANNTAWDGNETSPYHIDIIDDWTPYAYQTANLTYGVSGLGLEINVFSYDNDESFAYNSTYHSGQLYLYYRHGLTGGFTPAEMTTDYNASGYSALGFKITRWTGTVPGDALDPSETTYYYLEAKDQAFNWETPGYNNTCYWGTYGNPNPITVSLPSEPTLSRSSEPQLDADGDTVTYWVTVTDSTCYAIAVRVYWGNDSSGTLQLTDLWIGGSSVWPVGGNKDNDTWVNINDKYLGIAEYEIKLYFSGEIYNTELTSVFNTTYDGDFKVQDPISFTTPTKESTAPSFSVVSSGIAGRANNPKMYVVIQNNGQSVQIAGFILTWDSGGSKTLRDTYLDSGTGDPGILIHDPTVEGSSPLSAYPFSERTYYSPGSGDFFSIGWRFPRREGVQRNGHYTIQLYLSDGSLYTVSGDWTITGG